MRKLRVSNWLKGKFSAELALIFTVLSLENYTNNQINLDFHPYKPYIYNYV